MQNLNKKIVIIEMLGGKFFNGSLVEVSSDIVVLYVKNQFVYIPMDHIHSLKIDYENENNIEQPSYIPTFISQIENKDLNLPNILSLVKGIHVEIMVTRNLALHGVITSVMDDYFVFESPIYKTMFIATKHLKWIIPYFQDKLPYDLSENEFLKMSSKKGQVFKKTFTSQLAELNNQLVVLNLAKEYSQIGRIKNGNDRFIVLKNGNSELSYYNIGHIQIIYQA